MKIGLENLRLNTLEEEIINDNLTVQEEINKLEKYANKPTQPLFYYRRPSPIDTLPEEPEYINNNSYNGKSIYEWNLDTFIEKQISVLVHRMLMYSTICKTNGNDDVTVAKMIVAGFTGQLKGWWDNYLPVNQKEEIYKTVRQENGQLVQNAVYTLVVTILEHFTGRISDSSDNIRTLLQNLRCKTLTDFRWYKDTF